MCANGGPLCEPVQQAGGKVLRVEVGQEEPWQCISDFLEQVRNLLAHSRMGTSPQIPEQTSAGQSDSAGLRSGVEECPLVVGPNGDGP